MVPLRRAEGDTTTAVSARFPSPTELVTALRAGDVSAQAALWDRYSVGVRAVLRRMLGPSAEVEDALQEVFVQFFRSLGALRDPTALRPFLIGIAIRVARGALRKRRLLRWFRLTHDGQLPESALEPPDDDRARVALRQLYTILEELDVDSRLLFVLRHIEGLALDAIAQGLELSTATVKRKLARVTPVVLARAKQSAELASYLPSEPEEGR